MSLIWKKNGKNKRKEDKKYCYLHAWNNSWLVVHNSWASITDNILAAYETMHNMQTRMWSKVEFIGIKLDMSKAYDRV
jgi:hypothetical protein